MLRRRVLGGEGHIDWFIATFKIVQSSGWVQITGSPDLFSKMEIVETGEILTTNRPTLPHDGLRGGSVKIKYTFKEKTPVSFMNIFRRCQELLEADFRGVDTSKVQSLAGAFYENYWLNRIYFDGSWDSLTDVGSMFSSSASGIMYYNPKYDVSKLRSGLVSGWRLEPLS